MSVVVPAELDFSAKTSPALSYRVSSIVPEGSAPTSAAIAADTIVQFRLPCAGSAVNLAKSRFQISYTAAALVSKFTFLNVSRAPITSVALRTVSGVQLYLCPNFDQFQALVLPVTSKRVALQTETPVNSARSLSIPGGCPQWPIGLTPANGSGYTQYTTQAGAQTSPLAPLDAPAEWITAGSATAVTMNWDVAFQDLFPHSVLSCQNDLVFPEDLVLQVNIARSGSMAFTADDISMTTPATVVSAATISGCQIQLAKQQNSDIVNRLMAQYATQGLIVPVQDNSCNVESQGYPAAATTTYARNVRLDGSRGQSLLRVYAGATSVDDQKTRSACAYNLGAAISTGALWDSMALSLDQVRMSNAMLGIAELFDQQRPLFYESAVYNLGLYAQLGSPGVWDWTGGVDLEKVTPVGSGLPLSSELKPQGFNLGLEVLKSQTTYALNIVTVYVFARTLKIAPGMVMLQ